MQLAGMLGPAACLLILLPIVSNSPENARPTPSPSPSPSLHPNGFGIFSSALAGSRSGAQNPSLVFPTAAAAAQESPAAVRALLLITAALGLSALSLGGVSANHLDIAPASAGLVFGAGNSAATAAGIVALPVAGALLRRYRSWSPVFAAAALHYLVGAAAWWRWAGGARLPEDVLIARNVAAAVEAEGANAFCFDDFHLHSEPQAQRGHEPV